MQITFTNISGLDFDLYEPQPANKFIPEWYKNTESYINGNKAPSGDGATTATIKRCMPVFDAITAGYIITSYVDVYVSQKDGFPWYEWPSAGPIGFHPVEQAPLHPKQNGASFPKWINPWAIKTPKGYSTLFIQPLHRENEYFTIMPGIVDTDIYTNHVNFPFVLNDVKFEGLIPAGTPIAQVIPIKRDSWTMKIGAEPELKEIKSISNRLRSVFFDGYKNMFRQVKEYK